MKKDLHSTQSKLVPPPNTHTEFSSVLLDSTYFVFVQQAYGYCKSSVTCFVKEKKKEQREQGGDIFILILALVPGVEHVKCDLLCLSSVWSEFEGIAKPFSFTTDDFYRKISLGSNSAVADWHIVSAYLRIIMTVYTI